MSDYDVVQLARLEPPYLERLGLRSPPFAPTHEDRFFYLDNERLQLLNMLQHLTEYSSLLLMVTGERGVGKTSLLQHFTAEARPEWLLCPIQAHTMMDADQLLYAIAQGLGLPAPPHDPGSLQEVLYQQLLRLREQNRVPILLIDDAHELPRDALQAVFHLADTEAGDGSLLRTILFCEPQIETMLEDPAITPLRERITHSLELPPLDAEQTVEYLRHRLGVAGYHGDLPFSERQLQQIYKTSGGRPEKINEAAHEILNQNPAGEGAGPAAAEPVRRLKPMHAGLALLLLSLVGAGLLLQDDINRLFEEPASPSRAASSPPPPPHPAPTAPLSPAQTPRQGPGPAAVAGQPQGRNPRPAAELPAAPAAPEPASDTVARNTAPASAAAPPSAPVPAPATPTASATAPGPAPAATRPGAAPAASPSPQAAVDNPTAADAEGAAPRAAAATPADEAPAGLWDTAWIQRRPPEHFTLQILASHSKRNIEAFVQQHGLGGKAVAFASQRNGAAFYALIIGDYPDRQHAERAIARLPASLRQLKPALKPWIRSFASIQQSLAATRAAPEALGGAPASVAVRPPPAGTRLTDHVAWLWSQDPSHYTLQLLGGYDRRGVLRFMQQHQLLGKAAYYPTRRNGRDWYVVVYGSYPDRQTARAALNELPAGIRKTRPFVRQFSEIHAQLPHPGPAG